MKELDIKYKLGLIDSMLLPYNSKKNVGIIANCPNKDTIYLFGNSKSFDEWLYILIHEQMHAILFLMGVPTLDNIHHKIMHTMSEVWEIERN